MKNYLFIITLFFSFGLITAQEDDGVANGAILQQVDYNIKLFQEKTMVKF